MEDKMYVVTLRSKIQHRFEAATCKLEGREYVYRNVKGEETGRFTQEAWEGHSIEPDLPTVHVG